MKPYKWRTRAAGNVYVDSATGSDAFGDGSMQNPYQTLGKAWRGHTTLHPNNIICRGRFSEDMADGNHQEVIRGDYYGAATFDGAEVYTMYGFTTPDMIFTNCAYGTYDTVVNTGSPVLAGVGRAGLASFVGAANFVSGVFGASVLLRASALYMGNVGGANSVHHVGVVSPRPNPEHLFWFGTHNANSTVNNFSVYDIPVENRRQQPWNNSHNVFASSIFGKCAFFINDGMTIRDSVIAKDCTWWDCEGNEFVPTGETAEERLASLEQWITETTIPSTATCKNKIALSNTVLSDKTSEEIWNNPAEGDLTLRYDGIDTTLVTDAGYRGAFPPAINVPIMSDSTGHKATWDETTACGLITVADNRILVGKDTSSAFGEIKSKILTTNPDTVAIAGIFAQYASQYASDGIQLHEQTAAGRDFNAGDTLPVGRFVVRGGSVVYNNVYLTDGDVMVVTAEGTSFTTDDGAVAHEITDANVIDNMWLRTCPIVYAMITAADELQQGGTYLNVYDKEITYRGRTIAPGESFEAVNGTDKFACQGDADYRIAALFDDSRVPQQPWIPAQMWGEYFAGRLGGVYQTDADGNYLGSGNYMAWLPTSEGGYSTTVARSRAQARYIQLKITATKE